MRSKDTIQAELNELYEHFKRTAVLPENLATRASPPLLLSVSDKWASASKRVLIVGQETLGWDWNPGAFYPELQSAISSFEDFQRIPNSIEALVAGYRHFSFASRYPRNYRSPFWRAYRAFRSALAEEVDGNETAVLWTNLFRTSLDGGGVVRKGTREDADMLREVGRELLLAEIKALDPTSVVFFTGPNYNRHLYALFEGVEAITFKDYAPEKTSTLAHPALPHPTFRTYHPGYLNRGHWHIVEEISVEIAG